MADITDVCEVILGIAGTALYPVPPTQADGIKDSIAGRPARLYQGWPVPAQLDADLKGIDAETGQAFKLDQAGNPVPIFHVSVYPASVIAASAGVAQVFEKPYVVRPAVHGISATIAGDTVTLSGQPTPDEFVTLVVDGKRIYSRLGTTADLICEALANDAAADYPGASHSGASVTVPGSHEIIVRVGAAALMGQVLHRQRQRVLVTVWAPDHVTRTEAIKAIDVALKQNLRITLPDQSQAILTYESTFTTDHWETVTVYRRDLTFAAEFATIEEYEAHEITAFGVSAELPNMGQTPILGLPTTAA
jgi:hypothetical protein